MNKQLNDEKWIRDVLKKIQSKSDDDQFQIMKEEIGAVFNKAEIRAKNVTQFSGYTGTTPISVVAPKDPGESMFCFMTYTNLLLVIQTSFCPYYRKFYDLSDLFNIKFWMGISFE